jgi:uncharacterized membrane protein
MRYSWLWPMIMLFLALVVALVIFTVPGFVLRQVIVMCFLLICPGMVLVRFFHLRDIAAEWTLAVVLSLALDAIIASIQLYAGHWSPITTLNILLGFCVVGAIVQLVLGVVHKRKLICWCW